MEERPKLNNVCVVLLSEFDIEKGSTLRHQYPEDYFGDPEMHDAIADHMLPDGCMNHDWVSTVFFLSLPLPPPTPAVAVAAASSRSPAAEEECCRGEEGVVEVGIEEEEEKEWTWVEAPTSKRPTAAGLEGRGGGPLLHCCCVVHCERDDSKRGATIRSMAVACSSPLAGCLSPLLYRAMALYFSQQDAGVLREVYRAVRSAEQWAESEARLNSPLPKPRLLRSYLLPAVGYGSPAGRLCELGFFGAIVTVALPPSPLGPESLCVAPLELLGYLEGDVLEVLHAVFSEQRVLVLAPGSSPSLPLRLVYSILALIAPPLDYAEFARSRLFPLVTLTSLPQVPGYLAGTTNPFFQTDPTAWDLLLYRDPVKKPNRLQLLWSPYLSRDAKSSSSSSSYLSSTFSSSSSALPPDRLFLKHLQAGLKAQLGESWVLKQFRLYTNRLIDLATGVSEFWGTDVRKNYELYNLKLSRLKSTASFNALIERDGFSCASQDAHHVGAHVRRLDFLCNGFLTASPETPAALLKRGAEIRIILRELLLLAVSSDAMVELLLQISKYYITYELLKVHFADDDFALAQQSRVLFNKLALLHQQLIDSI